MHTETHIDTHNLHMHTETYFNDFKDTFYLLESFLALESGLSRVVKRGYP